MGIKDDKIKIRTAAMYLSDVTMLWWRSKCNDGRQGAKPIIQWSAFVTAFCEQFFSKYAKNEARSKLHKICKYVQEFSSYCWKFRIRLEPEALLTFMDGLNPWARLELEHRRVEELSRALAMAKSLIDLHQFESSQSNEKGDRDRHHDEGDEEEEEVAHDQKDKQGRLLSGK
ncbi:hypothetical protein NL676_009830 [Syzygium grande]|nr:hypothetical protein NL676_009830 [Syzygium grande]